MEALTQVHVVCHQEIFPNIFFLMACQISDHGEACLCAISCEEDVFVDKKRQLPI
jgi:hypothetical protein